MVCGFANMSFAHSIELLFSADRTWGGDRCYMQAGIKPISRNFCILVASNELLTITQSGVALLVS